MLTATRCLISSPLSPTWTIYKIYIWYSWLWVVYRPKYTFKELTREISLCSLCIHAWWSSLHFNSTLNRSVITNARCHWCCMLSTNACAAQEKRDPPASLDWSSPPAWNLSPRTWNQYQRSQTMRMLPRRNFAREPLKLRVKSFHVMPLELRVKSFHVMP